MTPKQEAFAQSYTDPTNPDLFGIAAACYREHYNAENMSETSVWREAVRVLQNTKVATRINELMGERSEAMNVSLEGLTREIILDAQMAREKGQHSAAITGILGVAKLHGLLTEDRKNERSPLKDVLNRIERERDGKPRLVAVK